MRRLAPLFFAAAIFASCADPPPLPEVHVRVLGLRQVVGTIPFDPSSFTIELTAPAFNPIDASSDAGIATTRAIFWDRTDPFEFNVQLPAGSYGPPSIELRTLFECPPNSGTFREVVLGNGVANTGFTARTGSVAAAPDIAIAQNPHYCD